MKLYQHIRYFFYIAFHWGVKLAFFTLYHEWKGEKKYRINTTSFNDLKQFSITGNQLVNATEYMPVSYYTMELLLSRLPKNAKEGAFLDIGCGKGRAMCMAAHAGFSKVTGIDFAKEMIGTAEKNLSQTKQQLPGLCYELFWKDISGLELTQNISTVFLFNPFDELLMKTVVKKISESLKRNPRPFYVLYASPRHEDLFFAVDFDVIYRVKKFNYLEAILLTKKKQIEKDN